MVKQSSKSNLGILNNLKIGIEESILLFLIIIELLDFFRIIPPELEFVEKSVAIIAILYLTYKVSISSILTGHKYKLLDIIITTSFFLFGLRSAIGFVISASLEHSSFQSFYQLVVNNMSGIEKFSFILGVFLLVIISAILADRPIGKRCFLNIIHEEGQAKSFLKKLTRFLTIYLSLLAFILLVYTFIIEWLATTIDAPILIIIIFILLISLTKHKQHMKTESFLLKASETAEEFYEKFLMTFHDKKRISIAIIGILVLHLLVEIGHYLIPYTTGLAIPWYFPQLGSGHEPLIVPLLQDFAASQGIFNQFLTVLVYLINIFAVLFLFASPAYLWYHLYTNKKIRPSFLTWLFFGLITVFFINPVFKIKSLNNMLLIGADIMTQRLPHLQNVFYTLLAGLLVTGIFYILNRKYHKRTTLVAFFISLAYFGYYLYFFFIDVWHYYIKAIHIMTGSLEIVIALHLFIFFALQIIFYIGGFILLIYEVYTKERI